MNTAPLVEREALAGLVERVTFHNPDSGFCVLRVKVRGQRDLVTLVGAAAAVSAGEFIQASGIWLNDRTHGLQFKAAFLKTAPPTTLEGIERYLGSGMVKGIGPVYAGRLVAAFGEAVFDLIENEPTRLREVGGIGPKRAERIVKGWAEQKVIREIMLFLHSHGVGTSRAVRIFKTYGADAVQLITENPYRLARDIRGIGFKSADQIAMRLGIAKTAMIRARAGISYALAEAMDEGHCGLPVDELRELAAGCWRSPPRWWMRQWHWSASKVRWWPIPSRVARACFWPGCTAPSRPSPSGCSPWPRAAPLEGGRSGPGPTVGRAETGLSWPPARGRRCGWRCDQGPGDHRRPRRRQDHAGQRHPGDPAGPNVEHRARRADRQGRQAPEEATGLEAKTIHRLLEADPVRGGFKRHEDHRLDGDLLVVDEVSMVDVPLLHSLLKAIPSRAALILVGDVDQLPSVGPGQVLADIIAAGRCRWSG